MPFDRERYTIQQLSRSLDLPKSTIRFWEKIIGAYLCPERTPGGQRRYTAELLDRYKQIRDLRSEGQSLEQIKQTVAISANAVPQLASHELAEKIAEQIGAVVSRELYKMLTNESAFALSENSTVDDAIVSERTHCID